MDPVHLSIIIWRLGMELLELAINREPEKKEGELHGDLIESAIDILMQGVMEKEGG